MSIYRYERRIWLAIEGPEGINHSKEIILENKKKLFEYATYLKAVGKSLPRQDKLLRTLKKLAELLGPTSFKEATKNDMVQVLANVTGSEYTRRDFQEVTKQFYAWLLEVEDPLYKPKLKRREVDCLSLQITEPESIG